MKSGREVRAPLIVIFKKQFIMNTLTAYAGAMASCMVTYYSIWALIRDAPAKATSAWGRWMVGAPWRSPTL